MSLEGVFIKSSIVAAFLTNQWPINSTTWQVWKGLNEIMAFHRTSTYFKKEKSFLRKNFSKDTLPEHCSFDMNLRSSYVFWRLITVKIGHYHWEKHFDYSKEPLVDFYKRCFKCRHDSCYIRNRLLFDYAFWKCANYWEYYINLVLWSINRYKKIINIL